MTFEQYIERDFQHCVDDLNWMDAMVTYRRIWDAATAAERSRCAGIAKKVGNLHLSRSEWLACSEKIYEEIIK